MSIISIKNIDKTYESGSITVQALESVSFQINEGEFVAIVGPSGSGKTTLLNIVGGLDSPDGGEVMIGKTDITKIKESEMINFRLHHIGFVFQAFNLIPVLSALENVEFIMMLQKVPKAERQKRAKELLEAVGLGDRIQNRPAQLSGGQQQRVAVARALASNPAFVLADEPTANLDSHTAEQLLDIMERLNKELNMTFVFSTHDQRVINRAKRVITLEDGKIFSDIITEKSVMVNE